MPNLYRNHPVEFVEESNDYINHISAMTNEGLYSKSEIAAELAWRDDEINHLKEKLSTLQKVYREDCNNEIKEIMRGC